MIEQIIEKKEIQTGLKVKIDGVIVDYNKHVDKFAYTFVISIGEYEGQCKTKEEAKEICLKIIAIMEMQSYDHGAQWRRTELAEDISMIDRYRQYSMTVNFRIRDSY